MRNLLVALCCAALVGSVSVAAAQTSGPTTTQQSVKAHDPMNANAKMKKKSKKKTKKSDDAMKKDTK